MVSERITRRSREFLPNNPSAGFGIEMQASDIFVSERTRTKNHLPKHDEISSTKRRVLFNCAIFDQISSGRRPLTERQLDVLEIIPFQNAKQIAATLGISVITAEHHTKAILKRLHCNTSLESVALAEELNFYDLGKTTPYSSVQGAMELTPCQLRVMFCAVENKSKSLAEVAELLFLTTHSVNNHLTSVYAKTKTLSREHLFLYYKTLEKIHGITLEEKVDNDGNNMVTLKLPDYLPEQFRTCPVSLQEGTDKVIYTTGVVDASGDVPRQ